MTDERCEHAVDVPDWAGLREPTSWKERAIAAEAENDYLTERLESSYETSDRYNARIGEVLEQAVINETRLLAERDALQARLDAMTVEWGVALPGEPGFETPDRATAESFVRDYPEEEYSLVQRLVGPWTVVPDSTRLEDSADGSSKTGSDLNATEIPGNKLTDPEPYVHPQHGRAAIPHTGNGWKYEPRAVVPEGGE